jgi:FkbM family methyltransferase
MWEPCKVFNRYVMKNWAKTGKALGYIYNILDNHESLYNGRTLTARVRGGLRLRCNLSDHVQSRIYFFGAYEPNEVFLLNSLIDEDSVVLDVGANIGFYSLFLSNKIKTGRIHAFEPVPANLAILRPHIEENHRQNIIHLHPVGLYSEETTLTFSLPPGMDNNRGSFTAGATAGLAAVQCQVTTLDRFVETQNLAKINFIKMDIEGAELSALKGGERTLARFQPNLLLEINAPACSRFGYTPSDIEKILKAHGYRFYKIGATPADSGFIDSLGDITQVNIFALNEKTLPRLKTQWDPKAIARYFLNP